MRLERKLSRSGDLEWTRPGPCTARKGPQNEHYAPPPAKPSFLIITLVSNLLSRSEVSACNVGLSSTKRLSWRFEVGDYAKDIWYVPRFNDNHQDSEKLYDNFCSREVSCARTMPQPSIAHTHPCMQILEIFTKGKLI
jgi:hypothetical protein